MPRASLPRRSLLCLLGSGALAAALVAVLSAQAQQPNLDVVRKAEAQRVAVIAKARPAVVAIFAAGGQGGGTGVLVSKDGYALTNWHVVKGMSTMICGLPDGNAYHGVVVGLDKVGDVALIKLLPLKDGQEFPFAPMGDSDTMREGDWSLAMGNPFLLATDFQPTVTFGLISGVHRYQYPAGTLLEYTDCIQIDTSINPGNSGGPLFNLKGEIIGINGRGSFDKRGRVNSGVGYAISINQIKNFLGHLRAGLDTDHASLGALVKTEAESAALGKVTVTTILEDSDAFRRGMDLDDEIVTIYGRRVISANDVKNVLGLYPRGWRIPVEVRRGEVREGEREGREGRDEIKGRQEILVRLMGVLRKEIGGGGEDGPPRPPPGKPGKPGIKPGKQKPSPASKFFVAKAGFANYYFNKLERDRLLETFRKKGDFSGLTGDWALEGKVRFFKANTGSGVKVEFVKGKGGRLVRMKTENAPVPEELDPLGDKLEARDLKRPDETGMLGALYLYHRLLTLGVEGFGPKCDHGGHEPLYPPPADGKEPASLASLRVDTDVLNTRYGPYQAKWFFNQSDQMLRAVEMRLEDNEDPCEIYFSDYRAVDGRMLPHRLQVHHAGRHYATFEFTTFRTGK
ncbi:MAG: trypsin-like peptidase domain-containing protein [Gemmataceae bacterium]|nr:trypsin-like peptidase domain-containing protein [Gemmataceae bacterium]